MPAASQLFSVGSYLQQVPLAGFQVLVTDQCRLRAYIRPLKGRQGRLKGSGFCLHPGNPADTPGQKRISSCEGMTNLSTPSEKGHIKETLKTSFGEKIFFFT